MSASIPNAVVELIHEFHRLAILAIEHPDSKNDLSADLHAWLMSTDTPNENVLAIATLAINQYAQALTQIHGSPDAAVDAIQAQTTELDFRHIVRNIENGHAS